MFYVDSICLNTTLHIAQIATEEVGHVLLPHDTGHGHLFQGGDPDLILPDEDHHLQGQDEGILTLQRYTSIEW